MIKKKYNTIKYAPSKALSVPAIVLHSTWYSLDTSNKYKIIIGKRLLRGLVVGVTI